MYKTLTHPLGKDFKKCTGCAACAAACPREAIAMEPNFEGFLYPVIKRELCDDCGTCRRICPIYQDNLSEYRNNNQDIFKTPTVYASWHLNDSIRRNSSSGGVFTALAYSILSKEGAVVGAAYDDKLTVRHIIIENKEELALLTGSKYVQSHFEPNLYRSIRDFLKQGRTILFSGTPCQVAGLRNFLKKPYETLFCCDVLCHGVPSQKVFHKYKTMLEHQYGSQTQSIAFRRKDVGWKKFSVSLSFSNNIDYLCIFNKDPFMLGFLRNYYLRLSCYSCKFTSINRLGDLTLADFWGVRKKYPEYDLDDKGTSLVLVNNNKGQELLDNSSVTLFIGHADLNTAIKGNPVLTKACNFPAERDHFFRDLEVLTFAELKRRYRLYPPPLYRLIASRIKHKMMGVYQFAITKLTN